MRRIREIAHSLLILISLEFKFSRKPSGSCPPPRASIFSGVMAFIGPHIPVPGVNSKPVVSLTAFIVTSSASGHCGNHLEAVLHAVFSIGELHGGPSNPDPHQLEPVSHTLCPFLDSRQDIDSRFLLHLFQCDGISYISIVKIRFVKLGGNTIKK